MKKVTIMMCLLAICLAGCGQNSFWAFGDNDALAIRLGTEVSENVEVGVSSMWWDDTGDSQEYGAYALYHIPGETISTYAGAQTPLNNTYYDKVSPVVGIVYDEIFFLEYQYKNWESKESQEEDKIVFGVRVKF